MSTVPADEIGDIRFLETGTFLDALCGGIPFERITEIYGEQKTGKSTVCLQIVAAAQKQGLRCLWVDVECSFTKDYASSLGVDTAKLGLMRNETAEQYLDEIEEKINSGDWDLIVMDSIGDLSSRVELEKMSGEKTIGIQASLITKFVLKLAPKILLRNMIFIGINHSRIDVMKGFLYTMGGKKWSEKKKLSIRLREKPGTVLKSGENTVGKVVIATVDKSAVRADEKKEMEVHIIFGSGFSAQESIIDEAVRKGVITRQGNTYWLGSDKLGTISKLREKMKDPAFAEEIKSRL